MTTAEGHVLSAPLEFRPIKVWCGVLVARRTGASGVCVTLSLHPLCATNRCVVPCQRGRTACPRKQQGVVPPSPG